MKKGVLENIAKFIGKHLCQSLFFNKVEGLRPATLLKKRLAQVFSCEFCEFFKNTFFTEHLRLLLLKKDAKKNALRKRLILIESLGWNIEIFFDRISEIIH